MSAADWEKYRAPLYERPPTVTPAWLTEHTAVVEAVTLRHLFTLYYPGEIACDCEWTAQDDGSRAGDERLIAAWSKHHAQEVTAALAAEAEKGGA